MTQNSIHKTSPEFCVYIGSGVQSKPASVNVIDLMDKPAIKFDTYALNSFQYNGWQPVHYDLLKLAAGVEYCDRSKARSPSRWCRRFKIQIEVDDPKLWANDAVKSSLKKVLSLLTGDDWTFEFVSGSTPKRDIYQTQLPFGQYIKYIMPFSDGLDSRAASALLKPEELVKVRVTRREKNRPANQPFNAVPFLVKPKRGVESSVRSRAFKFSIIAAIAADLSNTNEIVFPESGQGALGPVIEPPRGIPGDYRNHPRFFSAMSDFLKKIFGKSFTISQPRLWFTKAQTIKASMLAGAVNNSLADTRSCWQQRSNVKYDGKFHQCGLCAACLLRRMSCHAAGLDEAANTYSFSDLSVSEYTKARPASNQFRESEAMVEHAIAGVQHMQAMANLSLATIQYLRPHAIEIARATNQTVADTESNLRQLFKQHSEEWHSFLQSLDQQSFIRRWAESGKQ